MSVKFILAAVGGRGAAAPPQASDFPSRYAGIGRNGLEHSICKHFQREQMCLRSAAAPSKNQTALQPREVPAAAFTKS
jgi:hypothetical protein